MASGGVVLIGLPRVWARIFVCKRTPSGLFWGSSRLGEAWIAWFG